jgi:hypothetical protein
VLGGEQRLLFLHKARKGRAYVSDQRDGLLYVKRVTYEQLVYREKGQVSDLSTFNKKKSPSTFAALAGACTPTSSHGKGLVPSKVTVWSLSSLMSLSLEKPFLWQ